MPATALPASGDPAGGVPGVPVAPKTCDASGMAMIHRFYRASFGEGPMLVNGVAEGDAAHADIVGDQLALISASLHTHHEGEDLKLWDWVEQRAPSCVTHAERMKEQHAVMLVHLKDLDAALPAWRASGARTDAVEILAALAGVNAALAIHLPDEEANIVPVMETVLTQKEVDWFGEHGRKASPKGTTWISLGGILAAQPDGGTEFLNHDLPAPVRLLWRLVGKPQYEKNRKALVGTPAG